jgi:hypothetical protein
LRIVRNHLTKAVNIARLLEPEKAALCCVWS